MIRDAAHFESILDLFKRAALGEVCWEAAMTAISDATRSTSANLIGAHDGRLQFAWTNNLDPAMWLDLGEAMNDAEQNPRLRYGSGAPAFTPVEGLDYGSDDLTRRFPVYGEVCRKYDLGFGSLMNLELKGPDFVGMALLRGRRQGHGDAADAAAMTALAPHLLDAVRLRRAVEDQGALIASGALEQLSVAAFLCNAWGRVVGMTARAEAMVGPAGALSLRDGFLSCHCHVSTRRLRDAVVEAARRTATPVRTLVLITYTGERIVAEVAGLPVPVGALDHAPRAIVTVRRKRQIPPAEILAAALDLTLSEAAVVHSLALGLSRAQIAERRGASLETVRSQLKSVFAKLEISREVELVARVHDLS